MEKLPKLLGITARKSQLYYGNELAELQITTGQYMFIVSICENPGLSQEELGHTTGINKSTVAKAVAGLEQEKYLIREVDAQDKRGYRLYPTQKAKEVYPKIVAILDQWKSYLVSGMTQEEVLTLVTLMTKVENNARKYAKMNKGVNNEHRKQRSYKPDGKRTD